MEALRRTLHIGQDTIAKAEVIVTRAPESVKQKLRSGELSINAAYREIKKTEQQEAKAQAKAAVPKNLPAASDRYVVHQGTLAAVGNEVADRSVNWVVTDPPYGREHLHLYRELSDFASRVLRPGGSLICMVGQSCLPEIIEQLGKP